MRNVQELGHTRLLSPLLPSLTPIPSHSLQSKTQTEHNLLQ